VDERLSFVLTRRLICRIGMFSRTFPRLVLRSADCMVQFRNAGFENLLKMLALVCGQHTLILRKLPIRSTQTNESCVSRGQVIRSLPAVRAPLLTSGSRFYTGSVPVMHIAAARQRGQLPKCCATEPNERDLPSAPKTGIDSLMIQPNGATRWATRPEKTDSLRERLVGVLKGPLDAHEM
jgi:hypothetical protein